MRGFLLLSLLFGMTFSYGQTDTSEVLVQKNEEKIQELKNRLESISENNQGTGKAETIIPRLVRIEEDLSLLIEAVDSLELLISEKLLGNDFSLMDDKLSTILKLLENNNTQVLRSNSNSGIKDRKGDFKVVVESQRTLEMATQAKVTFEKRFNVEVEIIKSSTGSWFYLVLPKVYAYKQALNEVNIQRSKGVANCWWLKM